MDTIFTKIINRQLPSEIVYEDDVVLAFLDIKPINPGHTLVIPKEPFVNIFDGKAEILAHMIGVAKKIARALKETGLADGVNILMNNGEAAGQEVFHAHLHVIPRYQNDKRFSAHPTSESQCSPEQLTEIKTKLSNFLKL